MKHVKTILLLFIVILSSGCLYTFNVPDAPKAYFDMGHGERFSPNDGNPRSYTEFYYKLYEQGFDVEIVTSPLTSSVLSNADLLILAGPMDEFSSEEISDIRSFVNEGGNLFLLVRTFDPVNDMIDDFGIVCSSYIGADGKKQKYFSSQNFHLLDTDTHVVTEGIESIAVFGSLSITTSEPARTVAWASNNSWINADSNIQYDVNYDELERMGIVAVSEYGSGKVVVITDDALFIDVFVGSRDNRLLLNNIITWFGGNVSDSPTV